MDLEKEVLIAGSLLHDIGKVSLRAGKAPKGMDHSEAGADWAKSFSKEKPINQDLIDCIRFHHGNSLKTAGLKDNSPAWIVYEADNIAAGTDRRSNPEGSENTASHFKQDRAFESVFNVVLTSRKKQESKKAFCLKDTLEQEKIVMLPRLEKDNAVASPSEYAAIFE